MMKKHLVESVVPLLVELKHMLTVSRQLWDLSLQPR
jgi:hypothetical protein